MSLVPELINDSLDTEIKVSSLLRNALVVATTLSLDEFSNWCSYEIDGYRGVEIPDYRKTMGQVFIQSPRYGAKPIYFADPEMADIVSLFENRVPVGSLEDLIAESSKSQWLVVPFPPQLQKLLLAPFPSAAGIPELRINRTSVTMVVETVRNTILKWSLKLRKEGIIGEDKSFSAEEVKKAAADAGALRPNVTINVGSMQNSVLQLESFGAEVKLNVKHRSG